MLKYLKTKQPRNKTDNLKNTSKIQEIFKKTKNTCFPNVFPIALETCCRLCCAVLCLWSGGMLCWRLGLWLRKKDARHWGSAHEPQRHLPRFKSCSNQRKTIGNPVFGEILNYFLDCLYMCLFSQFMCGFGDLKRFILIQLIKIV